tara:strand:- start:1042 stop:2700 length:1659 start_codon:yes stop_codon:yes gene_type:complete
MKKLIKSFNILTTGLNATSSIRNFTVSGDNDSVFDLKITNEAGKYYSFEKKTFETSLELSTTATTIGETTDSKEFVISSANTSIIVGMKVTGNGISENTKVVSVSNSAFVIKIDKEASIPNNSTITFKAPTGLEDQVITSNSYNNSIVFPTVTSDDTYTIELIASRYKNTFLDNQEIEFDMNPASATFGDEITDGFRNDLYKKITIKQYADVVMTVNMTSASLTTLGVDFSSNTFNISQPRNYISPGSTGLKTSFSWPITVPSYSAITKSQDIISTYFETNKTQTVNGSVSSSRVVVLDNIDNLAIGMHIKGVSSGSLSGLPTIQNIIKATKTIIISSAQSFADGITLTFEAVGSLGPSVFGADVKFENLALTLTPLTVTVATASSDSTTLALVSAAGIQDGDTTIIKGVGVCAGAGDVNVVTRSATFTEGGGAYNGTTTVTHTADTRIVAGLAVSGTNIPSGATIASINNTNSFTLSVATTGGEHEDQTLTFSSNTVTLSAARSVEAGTVLEVQGTSASATITGEVTLKSIGDTNFTSTLDIDEFLSIGVS